MDRPYRIQEGCFVLPETFTDRSVNIFILEGNVLIHLKYEKNREDIGLFGI